LPKLISEKLAPWSYARQENLHNLGDTHPVTGKIKLHYPILKHRVSERPGFLRNLVLGELLREIHGEKWSVIEG